MYARTTSLTADRSRIDAGIAHVRDELWPGLRDMAGCIGMSLVVQRDTGKCIATTSWASEEALRDSSERVGPIRTRAAEIFGAATPEVQNWEVAVMHRSHPTTPGACLRATWIRVAPERADAAIEFYKDAILPQVEQFDGFASAMLLVDRASGLGVGSVAVDSQSALEATRERAAMVRQQAGQRGGIEILDVDEFELAFAHLHVPELV